MTEWPPLDPDALRSASEAMRPPRAPVDDILTGLASELGRRRSWVRRRNAAAASLVAALLFGAGWVAGRHTLPPGPGTGTEVPGLDPRIAAVQGTGAEFVASLAALRSTVGGAGTDEATRHHAEVVGLTLLNGAATELAGISTDPGVMGELIRISAARRGEAAADAEAR